MDSKLSECINFGMEPKLSECMRFAAGKTMLIAAERSCRCAADNGWPLAKVIKLPECWEVKSRVVKREMDSRGSAPTPKYVMIVLSCIDDQKAESIMDTVASVVYELDEGASQFVIMLNPAGATLEQNSAIRNINNLMGELFDQEKPKILLYYPWQANRDSARNEDGEVPRQVLEKLLKDCMQYVMRLEYPRGYVPAFEKRKFTKSLKNEQRMMSQRPHVTQSNWQEVEVRNNNRSEPGANKPSKKAAGSRRMQQEVSREVKNEPSVRRKVVTPSHTAVRDTSEEVKELEAAVTTLAKDKQMLTSRLAAMEAELVKERRESNRLNYELGKKQANRAYIEAAVRAAMAEVQDRLGLVEDRVAHLRPPTPDVHLEREEVRKSPKIPSFPPPAIEAEGAKEVNKVPRHQSAAGKADPRIVEEEAEEAMDIGGEARDTELGEPSHVNVLLEEPPNCVAEKL